MKYLIFQVGESNAIVQAGSATADNVPAALAVFFAAHKITEQARYFARRADSAEAQQWARTAAGKPRHHNTRPLFTVTLSGPEKRALELAGRVAAETTDKERLAVTALRAVSKLEAAASA